MPAEAARAASFPLTQSVWLAVARHVLGLDAEGGESLTGAPEGAVLALERGPTLHVMGAVGEAALGKANQARLAPARAGGLLMAMAGLWRDARLHKEDKARYKAMYRGAHTAAQEDGGDAVCSFFTCVVAIAVDARIRQIVLPALTEATTFCAVVLQGIAFITQVGDCEAVSAASGLAFVPRESVRVEVEGPTTVLLAFSCDRAPGTRAAPTRKRVEQYVTAQAEAQHAWRLFLKRRRHSQAKKPRTAARQEAEADASGEQASAAEPASSEAQQSEAGSPCRHDAAPAEHPPEAWGSRIWPWHAGPQEPSGRHLVHRLVFGCRAVSPATQKRWSQSVKSWREPWLQILWVYDPEDASLLDVQQHSHLLVRDASVVMPAADWAQWQARAFPIPLIKDLFQLRCLHLFGGWWADMDYLLLQLTPPQAPPDKTWMLATEFERRSSAYKKADDALMMVGTDVVSVNMGLMWASKGSDLLQEAHDKARALWAGSAKTWTGHRTQSGYQAHQRLIQAEFARPGRAHVMRPIVSSPFPRWAPKWRAQCGRKIFGVPLPAQAAIAAQSFTCNAWEGCWPTNESDSLCAWALDRVSRAPAPGVSPRVPAATLQAAAEVVANSLPLLTESGAPVDVALRAMASAITAICGSKSTSVGSFAADWPAERLALGFLHGALKMEWVDEGESPCVVTTLSSTLMNLRRRFGLGETPEPQVLTSLDLLFLDCAGFEHGRPPSM